MAKFYTDRKPLSFNLTYDVPFKFMFAQQGETESLLARFLNYILALKGEQEIIKLEYQNVEIPSISMEGRRLILDLKVTDQGGKTYNIELQREDRASIISRALFQYSRITGEQLEKNQGFDSIKPVVIVLLCNYPTYPDVDPIRLFKLMPVSLNKADGQETLPYLPAHFDLTTHFDKKNHISYSRFERRIQRAADSLNLLQIYLVELTKNFKELSPDQQTCLNYLTTDFFFKQGDQNMNQNTPKVPQDLVHKQASSEVKKWIEEAHARLEYFAGQPNQREAYEQEFLNILDHNTAVNFNYNEGKAEGKAEGLAEGEAKSRATLLPFSIQGLQARGMSTENIIKTLQLTPQEQALYLK